MSRSRTQRRLTGVEPPFPAAPGRSTFAPRLQPAGATETRLSATSPSITPQEALTFDALAGLVQGAVMVYDLDARQQGELVYISEGCVDLWGLDAPTILADEARIWLMAPQEQRR